MIVCLVLNKIIKLVDINNAAYQETMSLGKIDVGPDHLWTFDTRSMTFEKDLGLKGRYCYHPFNTVTVDGHGDCYVCICQAWLPIRVGNIFQFSSLTEIVQSAKAREIQKSILDGSYRYCDHNNCSIIKEDSLETEIAHRPDTVNWINFALDPSCNLTCPSCRSDFRFLKEGPEYEKRIGIVEYLAKLIKNHDHWIKFSISGDGDPFASLIYRHFLSILDLTNKKDVEIEIVTNGILLQDHWHKLEKIHNNIVRTKISLDAGSESVYKITRRGGSWEKVLNNIEFLINWKKTHRPDMQIQCNFVVQTTNYKDMPAYVAICDVLGVDEINFQKIVDWGTFDNFQNHAIWSEKHPEHKFFLNILRNLNNKKINYTNLTDLRYDFNSTS